MANKNKFVCLVYGVADRTIHAVYHYDNDDYSKVKLRVGELKRVISLLEYRQLTSKTLSKLIPV